MTIDAAASPAPAGIPGLESAAEGDRDGRRRRRRGGRGGRDRDETNAELGLECETPPAGPEASVGTAAEVLSSTAPEAPQGPTGEAPEALPREDQSSRRRGRGCRERGPRERRAEDAGLEGTATAPAAGTEGAGMTAAPTEDARALATTEAVQAPGPDFGEPVTPTAEDREVERMEPVTLAEASGLGAATGSQAATPHRDSAQAEPRATRVEPVRFELPVEALSQLADDAGLAWITSDPQKVAAVAQAIAAEPRPVHPPRERKPVPVIDDGPLVLVETRRDLSQIALPFETLR